MSVLIADIECESLKPTTIHMVGILDYFTDTFTDYHGDDVAEGLVRLASASQVIFYNGIGYDVPVIERLTEGINPLNHRIVEARENKEIIINFKKRHKALGRFWAVPHSGFNVHCIEFSHCLGSSVIEKNTCLLEYRYYHFDHSQN